MPTLYDDLEVIQKLVLSESNLKDEQIQLILNFCLQALTTKKPSMHIKVLEILSTLLRIYPICKELLDVSSQGYNELLHCYNNVVDVTAVSQLNNTLSILAEHISLNILNLELSTILLVLTSLESHEDPAVKCNVIMVYQKFVTTYCSMDEYLEYLRDMLQFVKKVVFTVRKISFLHVFLVLMRRITIGAETNNNFFLASINIVSTSKCSIPASQIFHLRVIRGIVLVVS